MSPTPDFQLVDVIMSERYINSGVLILKPVPTPGFDLQMGGAGMGACLHPGPKLYVANLTIHPDSPDNEPHIHPSNELAFIQEGSYFDARMDGKPIQEYKTNSWVWYNQWSSHRPLSIEGAKISYIAFDGIVMGENPQQLIERAVKKGIKDHPDALEFALGWLFPNPTDKQRILDEVLRT